jgi:hypothetical protein
VAIPSAKAVIARTATERAISHQEVVAASAFEDAAADEDIAASVSDQVCFFKFTRRMADAEKHVRSLSREPSARVNDDD